MHSIAVNQHNPYLHLKEYNNIKVRKEKRGRDRGTNRRDRQTGREREGREGGGGGERKRRR